MDLLLMEGLKDSSGLTLVPFTLSQPKDTSRTEPCRFTQSCIMKMILVSVYVLFFLWKIFSTRKTQPNGVKLALLGEAVLILGPSDTQWCAEIHKQSTRRLQ